MPTPCRGELMPGVWLTALQTERFKTACWSLQLLAPLSGETASLHAALPRILRWGTARYSGRQLDEALAALYAGEVTPTLNLFGEVQCAGFLGRFLDDRMTLGGETISPKAVQIMGDCLLHPTTRNGRLMPRPVEEAREELMEALRRRQGDPLAYGRAQLLGRMCKGEPYAVGSLGTLRSAGRLTQIRANRYYQELLPKARIEVYYCGALPPGRVKQLWREALMGLPRGLSQEAFDSLPESAVRVDPPGELRCHTEPQETVGDLLSLGFRTGAGQDRGSLALSVLSGLWEAAPGVARVQLDPWKGVLVVQAYAGQEGIPTLLEGLESIRRGAFSEEALEWVRRRLARALLAASDSQEMLARYWLEQAVAWQWITPEQAAALVLNVSRRQVMDAAARVQPDTAYILQGSREEEKA